MAARKFQTLRDIENFGRTRLSKSFYMRDFLHSEISQLEGIANLPSDLQLAIHVGKHLYEDLLEPLQDRFGRIAIRSTYRSAKVNEIGNRKGYRCANNHRNHARHIWDVRDEQDFAAQWPASSSRGLPTCMPKARIGGRWYGGYMTICRIRSFASTPGYVPSISAGTRSRNGSFAAT